MVPSVTTTHPAVAVPVSPPWRDWAAEVWWLLGLADRLLLRLLWAGLRRAGRLPPAALGPLAALALCGYMAFRAVSGYLADPRPLASVFLWPLLIGLVALLFLAWTHSGLAPIRYKTRHGTMTMRRTITGKTELTARYKPSPGKPATTMRTANHEGGHGAAIEAVGGHIVEAGAYPDGGGYCKGRLPRMSKLSHRVTNYIAVMVAGEVATGTKRGCGHDQHWAKWARDKLPPKERHTAWSRGYTLARSAQHTHAATARRVRDALLRTGKYRGSGGPERYL